MIYEPAEDSFLLEREVRKRAPGKRVLDVGTGSGILALAAKDSGAKEVLAIDIQPEAVKFVRIKGIHATESDLFERIQGKFGLIVFNPPYLPEDSREDSESALITSGGKRGDEIILRFLDKAGGHLEEDGDILLLVSSLTPLDRIKKSLREKDLGKKIVARKKIFMEVLEVWEIRKT